MGESSNMDGSLMACSGDELSFEDMRPEEQVIMMALEQAHSMGHSMLHISDLQAVTGWDGPAGNSKVRNNLRRLMRYGMIHRPIDGTYALVREPKKQPVVARALAPLVQIRKRRPNPRDLNEDEVRLLRAIETGDALPDTVVAVRKPYCALYGACLDQAISGKWAGFSCASCTSSAEIGAWQREQDWLALRALDTAAEEIEKHGKVNRIRGVKPGTSFKSTASE